MQGCPTHFLAVQALIEHKVIYLQYLLPVQNMGFAPKKWTPVYEDNKACIEWGNNILSGRADRPARTSRRGPAGADRPARNGRERAKHIDIRKHFAHEAIQNGHLRLVRVDTSEQLANIFTKGLHTPAWKVCISSILNGGRNPLP